MQGIYLVAMNKTVHHPLSMGQAPARHHRTSTVVTVLNLNGNLIKRIEIGMLFRIETPYDGLPIQRIGLPCPNIFVNNMVPGCQVEEKHRTVTDLIRTIVLIPPTLFSVPSDRVRSFGSRL